MKRRKEMGEQFIYHFSERNPFFVLYCSSNLLKLSGNIHRITSINLHYFLLIFLECSNFSSFQGHSNEYSFQGYSNEKKNQTRSAFEMNVGKMHFAFYMILF